MTKTKWTDLGLTYTQALHGMQSGVAYEHSKGSTDGSSKHLRVGVNSAFISACGLAQLLIEKNIITIEEYEEAQRLAANDELHIYEERNGVTFR